jgi:hypothetical protein
MLYLENELHKNPSYNIFLNPALWQKIKLLTVEELIDYPLHLDDKYHPHRGWYASLQNPH